MKEIRSAKQFFKYVDNTFGVGGIANYDQHQIKSLNKFLVAMASSDFGYRELESLAEIVKVYSEIHNDIQNEIAEQLEVD